MKTCEHCGQAWAYTNNDNASLYCPDCRWITVHCVTCGTPMRRPRLRHRKPSQHCSDACLKTRTLRKAPVAPAEPQQRPAGMATYDEAAAALSEHYGYLVTVGQVWTLVNEQTLEADRFDGRMWITNKSLDRYLGRDTELEAA